METDSNALTVAYIGLLGVLVGGIGNFAVQATVAWLASKRSAASERKAAQAAALSLGVALWDVIAAAESVANGDGMPPDPSFFPSVERDWQRRRELLATHLDPMDFLTAAMGFAAAADLVGFTSEYSSHTRRVRRIPMYGTHRTRVLDAAVREHVGELVKEADRAQELLIAFGSGRELKSETDDEQPE